MSDAEELLAVQIRAAGLPAPERQYRFAPGRRFAADFAWPARGLIVEVQGGIYSMGDDGQRGGRHNRGAGFEADCERMWQGERLGWRFLYVTPGDVRAGRAVRRVLEVLNAPLLPQMAPQDSPTATRPRSTVSALERQLRAAGIGEKAAHAAPLRIDPDDPREKLVHETMHLLGVSRARAEEIVLHNELRGG